MKQKKKKTKKKSSSTPSRSTINSLLTILESAHNALTTHHNFNLAEAWMGEYFELIPQKFEDKRITRSIFNALKEGDMKLLFAAIEAEIERVSLVKVELMRKKIARL